MEGKLYGDAIKTKLWKKVLSVFLAVIIGFGTIVTLIVGSSKLQDWLGIKSMLSAYAAEIVDTDVQLQLMKMQCCLTIIL